MAPAKAAGAPRTPYLCSLLCLAQWQRPLPGPNNPPGARTRAGKSVPMYRMRYRPGCWCKGLAPPISFLAKFEFLFEDAVGVSPEHGCVCGVRVLG